MDTITSIMVLIIMVVIFALVVTLWRVREEYQPDKVKAGEFERVRPRRQGFDQVYRPKEGITYEIIARRYYSDSSADFLLKHGRTVIPVHFTRHQLAPKGGNFLTFLAPTSARVAIELDGNIMDGLLGETDYEGQWEDALRDLAFFRNAYLIEKMKNDSLEVNFEDKLAAEVSRTTEKAIPSAIRATVEALTKHG